MTAAGVRKCGLRLALALPFDAKSSTTASYFFGNGDAYYVQLLEGDLYTFMFFVPALIALNQVKVMTVWTSRLDK